MRHLISRAQLEAHTASKEPGRYALNGICFTEDGAVSTDGRALFIVPYPTGVDFEEMPSTIEERPHEDSTPFILSLDAAKKAARNLPKKAANPILEHAVIQWNEGKGSIQSTNLEDVNEVRTSSIEAGFPDYRACMHEGGIPTMVSVAYLSNICAALKKSGAERVELRTFGGSDRGVQFTGEAESGETTAHGVLVPINGEPSTESLLGELTALKRRMEDVRKALGDEANTLEQRRKSDTDTEWEQQAGKARAIWEAL